MRIVSLNAWGGRIRDVYPYLSELDADVFMLQEVISGPECEPYDGRMLEHLREALPDHELFFIPFATGLLMGKPFPAMKRGLAILSRKSMEMRIVYAEDMFPEKNYGETGVMMIGVSRGIAFANVHGIWEKNSKADNPDRIYQSQRLLEVMEKFGRAVVAGDFNLLPDTKSISMLSEKWRNLISEYGIVSTRTSFSPLEVMGIRHADYMFLKGIEEKGFEVPDVEVSDHRPMILEI